MSYIVDSKCDIFSSIQPSSFMAREEIFTVIDHRNSIALVFDFERRSLDSRCIVRVIDYKRKIAREMRSRTLRFKIKSTFSTLPFTDGAITFTGGGFTASVITKNNTSRIIAALPDFPLPSGETSLKVMLSFTLSPLLPSFNELYRKGRSIEAVHSSIADEVEGTIISAGVKKEIDKSDFTAVRVWKESSFPLSKHNTYTSYSYGRETIPFSFILSHDEKECLLLSRDGLVSYPALRIEKKSEDKFVFSSDDKKINLTFTVFSSIKEKSGPFRHNRAIKYGTYDGVIENMRVKSAIGSIEL